MAVIPKFLSRPVQGIGAAGNWLWNGRFDVPEWLYGSATGDKPGSLNKATAEELLKKNQPRVNKRVQDSVAKAYRKLGLSYERASEDPDYVAKAFQQAREKLASAGAEIPEDASIHDLAAAYDKLNDEGKKAYSAPKAAPSSPGTGIEGAPAGSQTGSAQLANGRRVAPSTPLTPRPTSGSGASPAQPPSVGTTTKNGGTGIANDSHVRVDGAPLTTSNPAGQNTLARLQNETLTAAEIQAAEGRRDAQSAAATSEVSRLQRRRAERLRQDKTRYALEQEAAQFREQQRADMMERRYKNRSFRNADDWANLGRLREGEQMLDQKDYNAKVGDLVKRARKLRTAEGRAGLGSTDLKDMDMVFKTVGKLSTSKDADGNVSYGGNLTPAQIEALGKRIGGFESRAKANQAYAAVQADAHNSRVAEQYRQQYGLQGFSDEDVLDFHKARTAKTANDALDRMLEYGKRSALNHQLKYGEELSGSSEFRGGDPEALRQYEKDWDTIRGNVDVTSVFNRAMEDKATKAKFMSDSAGITGPGADVLRANLRRDTILRQMLKERTQGAAAPEGQTSAGPVTGAAQTTSAPQSGASPSLAPGAAQPAQPAAQVAAPGLPTPPASATPPVTPKKKPEDVQAAMFAGVPLRPRARR